MEAHLQLSRLCRLRTSPRLQTGLASSQADFTTKRLAVLQTWRLGRRKQVHVSGATLGAGDASCAVPTQWTADVPVGRGQGCAVMSLHCFWPTLYVCFQQTDTGTHTIISCRLRHHTFHHHQHLCLFTAKLKIHQFSLPLNIEPHQPSDSRRPHGPSEKGRS
jgi:hypothetical protein